MDNKGIIECELAYSKCFCSFKENEDSIRFSDVLLPDMYDHHYTYLKHDPTLSQLKQLVKQEISYRISESKNFCKILFDHSFEARSFSVDHLQASVGVLGYYQFDFLQLNEMYEQDDCQIIKMVTNTQLNDRLTLDKEFDEESLGIDFCPRRSNRRGQVYLSSTSVDSYVAYVNNVPVGNCDLFIHDGFAKIEDFSVSPLHQRKGYGTTILKALIKEAIHQQAHTIYLVTDEEDTAKDMYLKCGFHKIGEKTELFFNQLT